MLNSLLSVTLLVGAYLLGVVSPSEAASNGRLPAWVCNGGESPLFTDGFEAQAEARHSEPTYGSGGDYPGAKMRTVIIGSQSRYYYLYVPTAYPSTDPLPVMLVLHGAGGAGTAPGAADDLRTDWATTAEAADFIVVAPIASGAQGGWVPSVDYPMFRSVIDDVAAHYNIDLSRIYGWGFSSGGHVMHDLALHNYSSIPSSETFAAYGISAGVLPVLVCDGQSQPSCASFLPQVARKIPASLRVGTQDTYLPWVQTDRNALLAAGWNSVDYATFNAGHVIYPSQFPAIWQFFCPWQRRLD